MWITGGLQALNPECELAKHIASGETIDPIVERLNGALNLSGIPEGRELEGLKSMSPYQKGMLLEYLNTVFIQLKERSYEETQ